MVKFRNQYTYVSSNDTKERIDKESITLQGESFTVQEILDKFTQGLDVGAYRNGIYGDENPDFDSPDYQSIYNSDVTDMDELRSSVYQEIESLTAIRERVLSEKDVIDEKES